MYMFCGFNFQQNFLRMSLNMVMTCEAILPYMDEFEMCYRDHREKYVNLLNKLHFENLCKINSSNSQELASRIAFLHGFIKKKEFYENSNRGQYVLEFVLSNICIIVHKDCAEFLEDLLVILLEAVKHMTSLGINVNQERICEVISGAVLNNRYLNQQMILISVVIILEHLQVNFKLASLCIQKFFEISHDAEAALSLAFITSRFLKCFDPTEIESLFTWMYNNSYTYIDVQKVSVDDVEKAIELSINLYNFQNNEVPKFEIPNRDDFNIWLKKLMGISYKICLIICHVQNIEKATHLLATILLEFFKLEKITEGQGVCDIQQRLRALPRNIKKWLEADEPLFFHICYLLNQESSLLWEPKDIMRCMLRFAYRKRMILSLPLVKSFCYLYSNFVEHEHESISQMIALGNDLLHKLREYSISFRTCPLKFESLLWIMLTAPTTLKKSAVLYWIRSGYVDQLRKVSEVYNLGHLLLELLEENLSNCIVDGISTLLKEITDDKLSREIALRIPTVINKPAMFKVLLQSRPAILDDGRDCILLCKLLIIVIPFTNENFVIKLICNYAARLLDCLKDKNGTEELWENLECLKYLINRMLLVEDDCVAEVITFLAKLLEIQMLNSIVVDERIEINISKLLGGSPEKISKSLQLLRLLLKSKEKLFISISEDCVLELFYKLADMDQDLSLWNLRIAILNRYQWLAISYFIGLYVKHECLRPVNLAYAEVFLKFIVLWLKLLNTQKRFCDKLLDVIRGKCPGRSSI